MSSVVITTRRPYHGRFATWLGIVLVLAAVLKSQAAGLGEGRAFFLSGDYTNCIAAARQALKEDEADPDWSILLCESLLTTGGYPEALEVITRALAAHRQNIQLFWEARKAFLANGEVRPARQMLDNIGRTVFRHPADFSDTDELIISGKTLLLMGADPKRVLDRVFDTALKTDPKSKEPYLASGELALDKHDFALAAKKFEEGLGKFPDDLDLNFGLAKAYAPNQAALMMASLEATLERNSNHVGALLLLTDHMIDAEDYSQAEKLLDRVATVNPWEPDAWAYRAVIAELQNHPEDAAKAREKGLKFWGNNPRVDYLIGLKLSQNYRFQEGASHQRGALAFDPEYLPAKAQLAQDLLRLGDEAEGWKLAEEVQKQDAYDVEAYNLTTLHDTMAKFATLTNQDFVVRMNSEEAAIYGQSVLDLLEAARSNLCAKYNFQTSRPTIVEVFHEQKDFAVRTFGMPGNPGYLGVCFGKLITANGPAAQFDHPVNWQAVLWHEFCHVVTLQLTQNKMPRWLSEGISVYEELQANPSWGQRMTPEYREMVLGGELTPVAELSGAFLAPPSPVHLQFAYYEASLVVEFLVQRYGLDHLKAILMDLGKGLEINHAIETHTTSMENFEKEFSAFARARAETLAPGLDFEKPPLSQGLASTEAGGLVSTNREEPQVRGRRPTYASSEAKAGWIATHPTNYYALSEQAQTFMEQKQFQAAKVPLEKLVELYPGETGQDSAPNMLAAVYRELGETNAERELLVRIARQDDEATPAYERLMEMAASEQNWSTVLETTRRYLAVNPLRSLPYRYLALASEHEGERAAGIRAYQALLQLDPPDPAEIHFKLAQLLFQTGAPTAKRQLLEALEQAPRYQAALELLLEMENEPPRTTVKTPTPAKLAP